ncbi:MAG TPA: hypothetical protein VGQ87_02525 [Patescibacteria group bacterium]|jgi:Tol biopolymer transport system component|nr:hypothetical protein [Patescibacteria group bacterium]
MNKKAIIIIGLIVVLSFLAGIVLLFGKKGSKPATVVAPSQGEIKKLSDDQAISPVSSYDGSAVWYFTPDKRLFRVNIDGSGLSEFALPSLGENRLVSISWPTSGSDFIAVLDSKLGEVKVFYNSTDGKLVTLPPNIQSFDWLPDSKRIIYIWKSGDNAHQQMSIADADATGFRAITDVFWPDYTVKIANDGNQVLLYRSRIQGDNNKIYKFDLKTNQFQTLINEGINQWAMWLPGGNKFIFAQTDSAVYPRLFLYNMLTSQKTDLNINTAMDKIVLDSEGKFLYAAMPKKGNISDDFVKVDLTSFKQESYFQPPTDLKATDLFLVGTKLYYVNSKDSKIYYISK